MHTKYSKHNSKTKPVFETGGNQSENRKAITARYQRYPSFSIKKTQEKKIQIQIYIKSLIQQRENFKNGVPLERLKGDRLVKAVPFILFIYIFVQRHILWSHFNTFFNGSLQRQDSECTSPISGMRPLRKDTKKHSEWISE